jgi:uncharacterized protein YqgC (DUF456 family)
MGRRSFAQRRVHEGVTGMARRFGYLAFAGAGIGFLISLMIARPGHGVLPGVVIGALVGGLIEWFAMAAERLSRDTSDDAPRAR